MANILNTDEQIAIIPTLAEGSSIRSIERITGVHRDTIMRLGVTVLHIPPAVSPETAVRLAIAQELRANADIEAED
jgi:hypothetical protein